MTTLKNFKLTERSSERQADNSYFMGPFCLWGFIVHKKRNHICLLTIFLMCNLEFIWQGLAMSDQAQLICNSLTKSLISYMY